MSRTVSKLVAYARVLPRARRNRTDLARHMIRRPALMAAMSAYEAGLLFSSKVPNEVKALASAKASSLVGCPF